MINQNTRTTCLLFVLYCPGPLTVIYNMYESRTPEGSACIRYYYTLFNK